jgi:hypothetical protein
MFCGVFTFGWKEEICSPAEEQQINLQTQIEGGARRPDALLAPERSFVNRE